MVSSKVCLLSWLLSISCPLWWKVFSIVSKFLSQIVHLIISKHSSLWLVQETIPTIQQYINLRLILIIHVLSQISINNSILTISHHGNELRIVRFITILTTLIWRETWPKGKTLFNLSVLSSSQFWTDLNVEEKTLEWIRLYHIA